MQPARRTMLALPWVWALGGFAASAEVANLDFRDHYLFVETRINGRPMTALLDSGSQMSVIDTKVAAALGLDPGGSAALLGPVIDGQRGSFARGVAIEVAGLVLHPPLVVVADLSHAGNALERDAITMILGRDLFDAAVVAIDIGASTLTVGPPSIPRPGLRLPLTKEYGVETIPIMIDGLPAHATFDLGNSGLMMVSEAFARRAGLLAPERNIGDITVRTINGAAKRAIVLLHSVEIGGIRVPVPEAIIRQGDAVSDALIGIDVLRHFRMVCDFAHHAVWLNPV